MEAQLRLVFFGSEEVENVQVFEASSLLVFLDRLSDDGERGQPHSEVAHENAFFRVIVSVDLEKFSMFEYPAIKLFRLPLFLQEKLFQLLNKSVVVTGLLNTLSPKSGKGFPDESVVLEERPHLQQSLLYGDELLVDQSGGVDEAGLVGIAVHEGI